MASGVWNGFLGKFSKSVVANLPLAFDGRLDESVSNSKIKECLWPMLIPTKEYSRASQKANYRATGPLSFPRWSQKSSESCHQPSALWFNGVRRQGCLGILCLQQQDSWSTDFLYEVLMCVLLGLQQGWSSPLWFGQEILHISLLVTISLKSIILSNFPWRAEQMSSLCCFSSLLRMKGPILAGSSYLCKFSLRMIHKIIGCQSWTRDLQHIYSNLYYLWRKLAHRGYEDFAVSNHVLEQTKPLTSRHIHWSYGWFVSSICLTEDLPYLFL